MASIVLLGAGASFGSESSGIVTPPLGRNLFLQLELAGGVASEIPEDLKIVFRSNFELGMTKYREFTHDDTMRFQRELAHYLSQFRPTKNSAFIKLISTLGTERIIYCSLNYDLLFELSAASIGLSTTYGIDKEKGHIRLLKLHGSCNFWPDFPGTLRGVTISGSVRADIQAPIRPLTQDETIYRCVNEDSMAPAIAMYAEGKPVKISPDYVENQQAQWIGSLKKAKNVFIVGVRVHPIDRHIWGELAKTKANVFYFGFSADKSDFLAWKESYSKKNSFFIEADFRGSIDNMKARL